MELFSQSPLNKTWGRDCSLLKISSADLRVGKRDGESRGEKFHKEHLEGRHKDPQREESITGDQKEHVPEVNGGKRKRNDRTEAK